MERNIRPLVYVKHIELYATFILRSVYMYLMYGTYQQDLLNLETQEYSLFG